MNPGKAPPCIFHQNGIDGTILVHGDDIVVVTSRRHSKEAEDHLHSKCEVEVQTLGLGRR